MIAPRFAVLLCTALLASFALPASAWNRSPATRFATLPAGTAHPEGITADARGNLYVANFDVSGNTTVGTIVVFDRSGRWSRTLQIDNGSALLLGIAFNPVTHDLLVADLGKQQVLKVDPQNGASSVFASIPGGGGGPNALAFDATGNVYVSDSFQATIWRVPPAGGAAVAWVADPLLGTSGVPPFGANGLAFNRDASA
jgi:sugar lactone lactonase YvrE